MHISGAIPKMTIGWSGYPQMNIFSQLYMSLRFLFYPMFWPGVGFHQVILDWEILQRFHRPEFQQDSMMKNDPLRYFHHVDFFSQKLEAPISFDLKTCLKIKGPKMLISY